MKSLRNIWSGLGLAVVAAAVGLFVLPIGLVTAHVRPVLLDPPPGTVLDAAPAQVQAWFNGEIRRDPNWTFLQVRDMEGNRVDTGETQLSDDRLSMVVALQPDLAPGRYLVTWRNWDDNDGAILGDCYVFFVGAEARDAALAEGYRLDGGGDCERIDVDTDNGTPVPGETPSPEPEPTEEPAQSTATPANGDGAVADNDASDGIPAWLLVIGAGGGLVAGVVIGRLTGSRS
jgi:methionine-rich copper-binding protein CopC